VSAQLAHIKATNPQALISYNTGAPFGTVLRGMHDDGIDVPVATSGGNMTYGQMQQYAQFIPSELDFGAQLALHRATSRRGRSATSNSPLLRHSRRRPCGGGRLRDSLDPRSLRWISCAIFRRMRMRPRRGLSAKLHGWVASTASTTSSDSLSAVSGSTLC